MDVLTRTPDLASLTLFLHAIELRSFSKAAQRCHIALAAASRRIAFLEEMLKVSLFERSSRGVKPTPAGLALAIHAREILQSVDRLTAEMSHYASGVKGRIRLHANTSALSQFLPKQLASFSTRFPEVRIELEEQRSHTIIQAIAMGGADVGIIVKGLPTDGLETFPYRSDELVALLPKHHPIRAQKVAFERLLEYDFASLESNTSITRVLLAAAAGVNRTLRLRVQVWSFEAMARMVQAGLGVGVLPHMAAKTYAVALGLRTVPLIDKWAKREHLVCVRDRKILPAHAGRLVEHLTNQTGALSHK